MLQITCPFCGPREETEFAYGGEASIARPKDPLSLSDADWAEYLFMRRNPRGILAELWCHTAGCRRWFVVRRDTVSNKIVN
jgi:sarcosine oxidase, subunit delta